MLTYVCLCTCISGKSLNADYFNGSMYLYTWDQICTSAYVHKATSLSDEFIIRNKVKILFKKKLFVGITICIFFQSDATISFLRASRSGDLGKVLEFINSGLITDINTCNAVSSKFLLELSITKKIA